MQSFVIRPYDAGSDAAAVRAGIVELQDYVRALEPWLPAGEAIADAYLAHMLERCARWDGAVLVAEVAAAIAGLVCVWTKVEPEGPDERPGPYAYVSDLVVMPAHRARGIGRALLAEAERYARLRGADVLRIGVLARNEGAWRLYRTLGFADYHVQLVKPLV